MHCTHYVIFTTLWYWEAQHQAQDSWCALTTADTRGKIDRNTADDCPPNTTLDATALPFMRVLCCLMFNAVPPVSPRGCSSSCFQSVKIKSAWVQWDYFFPGVGFGISLCSNLRGQPISPACQSASEWQQTHQLHQALLPDFHHVLPLLRHHFVPLARPLMKILNSSGLSHMIDHNSPMIDHNSLQGDSVLLITFTWTQQLWATFQSISLSSYLAWNTTGWLKCHMSTMDSEYRISSSCLESYKFFTIQLSALDTHAILPILVCALILTHKLSTISSYTPRHSCMPVTTLSHKDSFPPLTFPT